MQPERSANTGAEKQPPNRVIVYVDGFNLYFGLKAKGWKNFYWLNIQALARSILKPDQVLMTTKYFTSRVKGSGIDN